MISVRRIRSTGRRLWAEPDDKGTAILEFALGAPVLILVVIGVFEVSLLMLSHVLLEGSIRMASRYGATGQEVAGTTREAFIEQMIRDQSAGLLDISITAIEVSTFADFDQIAGEPYPGRDIGVPWSQGTTFTDLNGNGRYDADLSKPAGGAGAGNDVVLYSVDAEWRTVTPLLAGVMGDEGRILLHAQVAIRNEPFGLDILAGDM